MFMCVCAHLYGVHAGMCVQVCVFVSVCLERIRLPLSSFSFAFSLSAGIVSLT